MLKVEIVKTDITHIDEIMEIEKLSFTIPWSREALIEEITRNKFAVYLSARVSGKIVGYIGMWCVCDEGHITNIAIHPEFRRNGIGSALMQKLIEIAMKRNITSMTLEVRKSNHIAQNLYKKFGFEACGIRKSYYADNGEDALIMWKHNMKEQL